MSTRTVETDVHADSPTGAPFVVEKVPWGPRTSLDQEQIDLDEGVIQDWPMVYILSNESEAYVGQTTSVIRRMEQHSKNPEKAAFNQASLIYNSEFNASVVTDYENRLIGLMSADGQYRLTNKNEGMTQSNYFCKGKYEEMFASLWNDLRNMSLAHHSISEIEESEVFKYSPFKCLNDDQVHGFQEIMDAIDRAYDAETGTFTSTDPIVVEGEPGTGKTILAVYLLKALKDNERFQGLNIRMLEPVTALRSTLQASLKDIQNIRRKDIMGPNDLAKPDYGFVPGSKGGIDILLVDEAHKLKRRKNLGTQYGNYDTICEKLGMDHDEATQVDWVIDQVKLPVFFYDPLQNIGPSGAGEQAFFQQLGPALEKPIELKSQMRVKGGNAYLDYIKDILAERDVVPQSFGQYEFVLHEDFSEFEESFERCLESHNLTRMLAGYAWEWKTKDQESGYDIEIDGVKKRWNDTYDNWIGKGLGNTQIAQEVGCIHSSQGYDLSYAYVIIGPDLVVDPSTGKLHAVRSSYYDRNGKNTATDDELTQYVKNIYYVLLTRGIYGTHVYACDPLLRRRLERLMPVVG